MLDQPSKLEPGLVFCVVYNASFRSCQVLDDEGEEDDDNEKDANQGSFVFSHFI